MTQLHAQPYDISATGFYFETYEQYAGKAATAKNDYGQKVEEFDIQFIDGADLDCELAKALDLNQVNVKRFLELVDEWEDHEKIRFAIAAGECGYSVDIEKDDIDLLDVDIYGVETLRELAEQFVEDGLFGDIPERLQFYIDYDAIARDLEVEYSETTIAGERFVFRCG